ncbi:TetR/AcrR family transcriptional regulator [Euzebya sp.]|uniref:TetR/AcrR family transcriptional regulator n=1 Tax=Euzebya sp. TaxID=1971409 RepID=UPI00351770F5
MARPQDPEISARLLAAAAQLRDEVGYDAVTMEAVAARAGVGKPALYRRWPTKAQLYFEISVAIGAPPPDPPDTGTLRGDLLPLVRLLHDSMAHLDRDAVGEQVGQMIKDPAFSRDVYERTFRPMIDQLMVIWDRAVARGEVRRDLDGWQAISSLASTIHWRTMVYGLDVDVEQLVDVLLDGVRPR